MENIKLFDMMLEKADYAAKRTRWILLVAMVVSFSQLGAVYNFGLSFLRNFSEMMVFNFGKIGFDKDNLYLKELQTALLKGWVESMTVNVSLLGVKFSVADMGLIGIGASFIVSVWLFFSARRENHLIGKTCILAEGEAADIRRYVFYGLSSTQMFGTLSENDNPVSSLQTEKESTALLARLAFSFLFYLPVISSLLVILSDVLSAYYYKAVFRGCDNTFIDYALGKVSSGACLNKVPFWNDIRIHWYVTLGAQFCMCLAMARFIYQANRLRGGTVSLLRNLKDDWGSK